MIGQGRSPSGGLVAREVSKPGQQRRLGRVVEKSPGDLGPGGDASDGDRSAIAFQGLQDSLDTRDAVQPALLRGLGQV